MVLDYALVLLLKYYMSKKSSGGLKHTAELVGQRLQNSIDSKIYAKLNKPVKYDLLELSKMSVNDLYGILEKRAMVSRGELSVIRDSVKVQLAFLVDFLPTLYRTSDIPNDRKRANAIAREHETSFLGRMRSMGMKVKYSSEVSAEQLNAKPNLILGTHQGGGWENYLFQGFTGLDASAVVKSELMDMPGVGPSLRSRGMIPVFRKNLKDPVSRLQEIERIARDAARLMAEGGNVIIFFEGTRSENGQIAATPGRRQWARDFMRTFEEIWAEDYAGSAEYQKQLLVFHTMVAMPDTPEKDHFLSRFRLGETVGAKLVSADSLTVPEEEEDFDDQDNLFGKARSVLKEMLIEDILEKK